MKTIKMKKTQEKQIKEVIKRVNLWKNKFNFSFATLLFTILLLVLYIKNQFIGVIPTIVLSCTILVFVQQSIRSYNYFKFHRVTYRSLKMLHKMVDDIV
jgi:hypothetical protein